MRLLKIFIRNDKRAPGKFDSNRNKGPKMGILQPRNIIFGRFCQNVNMNENTVKNKSMLACLFRTLE